MRATVISIAIFTSKWVLAGLVCGIVLLWIRPELRDEPGVKTAPITAVQATPALPLPVIQTSINEPKNEPIALLDERKNMVSYADAVSRTAPAVVNIYTARVVTEPARSAQRQRFLGAQPPAVRQRVEGSLGSGVIVDVQGHVITNHHVIANAQEIRLQLADGRIADAKRIGSDPDTDLAVLKINLNKLPVMPMGRSSELRVGDVALAIGNPYGLSQTVTHGIISATGRNQLGLSTFENFLQTDAAINVGNSGGALINAHGQLIGINTAVLGQGTGSEGIGFAIPVDLVRGVVAQILEHGHVRRGWLGVDSQAVTPQRAHELGLATTAGAELVEVYADSPAARAGLHAGDVITRLNGQAARDERDAMNRVAGMSPGSQLRIQGRGIQGPIDVRVVIEERPIEATQ